MKEAKPGSPWHETYAGGSADEEHRQVRRLADDIMQVQLMLKKKGKAGVIRRAFHAKQHAGVVNAEFRVLDSLPPEFQVGFLVPGAVYPTTARFSNASGLVQPDSKHDMRGLALRIQAGLGQVHDLLMTNGAASHARNARQFIAFARAMAGSKLLVLPRLLTSLGPFETIRMFRVLGRVTRRPVRSVALERYLSRAPITCGARAVKFLVVPAADAPDAPAPPAGEPDYLHQELVERLRAGPVIFDFRVQLFVDEKRTPIEDGSVEWLESVAPPVTIARLFIPQQDLDGTTARADAAAVDHMEFNPWNTSAEFRPLGNLNRARQMVYAASADHRAGYRFRVGLNRRNRFFGALAYRLFAVLNRLVPWHKLPKGLGALNLLTLRQRMRKVNLYDTEDRPNLPQTRPLPRTVEPNVLAARAGDERCFNDLSDPQMGCADARFAHIVPFARAMPQPQLLLEPDPRRVSQVLLRRDYFKPVPSLNLFAAAWIQFMIHGWFDHYRHKPGEKDIRVPIGEKDPWPNERPMRIPATVEDRPASTNPPRPPIYRNTETSWWDGSQIYGSREALTRARRSMVDGKLTLGSDGLLPLDPDLPGVDFTGFNNNWWVGLSLLHNLFVREHNAICDALRREYPTLDDDRLFATARMVNCALMGKIHTVEWTPAILANPTLEQSMSTVWYGAPKDWLSRLGVWLVEESSLRGIPGSLPDHHAAPYSINEEFVAVYKMHPLMPDDFSFFAHADGRHLGDRTLTEIQGKYTRGALTAFPLVDLYYSFGVANPGAITLHNFPRALQNLEEMDGRTIDLATIDIIRERERGMPRYNDFRELMHMPRVKSWRKLAAHPAWAKELEEVYGHIDRVDAMVGMFAETPPTGFGFSDTAFHVFVLTASRRVQSDRFFTVDYTPAVYTPLGMRWVESNTMKTVLLRHFPELLPFLQRVQNAFKIWHPVARGKVDL
jgi:hypothetical protein